MRNHGSLLLDVVTAEVRQALAHNLELLSRGAGYLCIHRKPRMRDVRVSRSDQELWERGCRYQAYKVRDLEDSSRKYQH